ncbi:MAG: hypothetical protein WD467_03305 [Candidatus Saccharimonadales bacterium]
MTGREKILIAINLIDRFLQESLSGNKVSFSSEDLDVAGVRLEDQKYILDALQDDYECIKYSYTKPNKKLEDDGSISLNNPTFKADILDVDYHYLFGKMKSLRNYKVNILDNFESVRNKARKKDLEKYQYHDSVLTDKKHKSTQTKKNRSEIIFIDLRNNLITVGLRYASIDLIEGANVILGKPLRYDSPPYNFMRYILKNHDRPISIHEIQEKVEGCKTKTDLSELVRNCHFNRELKKIFFERTTQKTIRFTPWKEISGEQLEWFEKWLKSNRDETVTNREILPT